MSASSSEVRSDAAVPASSSQVKQLVRQSSSFTYFFSFLIQRSDRPFFWAWYSYLRWVDDIVDSNTTSQEERCAFIESQTRLIVDVYRQSGRALVGQEDLLRGLAAYDIPRGERLKASLLDMLTAMRFDLRRAGKIAKHEELHQHFRLEVSSYLSAIASFCGLRSAAKCPPGSGAAYGAKIAHILRDFLSDCREGQINVSQEELDAYHLDPATLGRGVLDFTGQRWVAANVRRAERLIRSGLDEARQTNNRRYACIVAVLAAKYQAYLSGFRSNAFVLREIPGFPWRPFLYHLLSNLYQVLIARGEVTSSHRPERLSRLVPGSTLRRAAVFVRLYPLFNTATAKTLNRTLKGANVPRRAMRKFRLRFTTAYWLGRSSCAFIDPVEADGDKHRLHCAGMIYAFWSLAVIALDSLVDEHGITPVAARALVAHWLADMADGLRSIYQPNGASALIDDSSPGSHTATHQRFILLVQGLHSSLTAYADSYLSAEQQECLCRTFTGEAHSFLTAQINSSDQKMLDPLHGWDWYAGDVLNQKTLGFALAPMSLWCRSDVSIDRRRELDRAFFALNEAYCHWQLLDDVADYVKDTADGLITAPGYILISQGMIAHRYVCLGEQVPDTRMQDHSSLADFVWRSHVLCDWFLYSSLCDAYRHDIFDRSKPAPHVAETLVRCALSNCEEDARLSLSTLCNDRLEQANQYIAAMKTGSWSAASRALVQSRVNFRILFAAEEECARARAKGFLSTISDHALLDMLRLLEMLILHCAEKAYKATLQDTAI
jgi:phytoene/squalene synthetase